MNFPDNGITADSEVCLYLNPSQLVATTDGRAWLEQLRGAPSQQNSQTLTEETLSRPQPLAVTLPIGEFPSVGKPRRNRKGIEIHVVPDGVGICSYSDRRAQVQISRIRSLTVNPRMPCASVGTARKRVLTVSNSDSLATFDPITGTLAHRSPRDAIGYLVPYVHQEPIVGIEFSCEIGWLHASLAADGWLRPTMVGYAKNDRDMRDEFVRIAREFISSDFTINEYFDNGRSSDKFGPSVKLHLFGSKLRQRVHDCYCPRSEGRGALFKRLPDPLLSRGSRDCLLGLLAGALEGDSSLGWSHSKERPQAVCRCNTSSSCFVKDLQRLGRLLGLRTSVTTTPPKGNSNESFAVLWSLPDIIRVLPELEFVSAPARQWQADFLASPPTKDSLDVVPIFARLAECFADLLLGKGELTLYGTCQDALRSFSMTRRAARRILRLTAKDASRNSDWQAFEKVVRNESIHWDRIANVIGAGRHQVFCLAVPDTRVFEVQNGLIVHGADLAQPVARSAALDGQIPQKHR